MFIVIYTPPNGVVYKRVLASGFRLGQVKSDSSDYISNSYSILINVKLGEVLEELSESPCHEE